MIRWRLPMLLAGALLAALLMFLPLRLAIGWVGLGDHGLAARAVTGTLWSGQLKDARMGGVALGDLNASLSPIQLLVGRVRIDFSRTGAGADRFRGAIGVTRHSFGIDDLTATLPAGDRFAPLPISTITLDDVSVRFVDGRCAKGQGGVRATVSGNIAGVALTQGLSGNARCDGANLLLPLLSQSGMETLNLRLSADGRYRAELLIRSADRSLGARLGAAGFLSGPNGYVLSIGGTI